MKKIILASVLSIVSVAGMASAQGRHVDNTGAKHERGARFMAQFDTDGDGTISDAEKQAAREAMQARMAERKAEWLAEFDTDGDGTLSDAEKQAARAARGEAHFAKRDANGDGVLSADEVSRMPQAVFAELDTDGSGTLSPDEMAAARGKRGVHGEGHGHHGKRGAHGKRGDRGDRGAVTEG